MKKKVFAVLMSAMMVCSLAACGSSTSTQEASTATSTEATTEAAATAASSEAASATASASADASVTGEVNKDFKLGIVTDTGGVNDGSFNQSAWEGAQAVRDELGLSKDNVSYLESHADSDYIPNIETFVDEDYDLIVCIGYQLADALREEATANPNVHFAIVDDSSCADLPNVTCLMFEQSQASYLVGYVAGLATKSNTIGFVLGMSTDTMNQFGYGYLAGAIDANPKVKVLQTNANSFSDTAAGKTAANNMVAKGADVIFHAAGGTGLGVIDACQEAGIWAIGVDSDQYAAYKDSENPERADVILTSMLKEVGNSFVSIFGKIEAGEDVWQKTLTLGLADSSVGYVDNAYFQEKVPEDVRTKMEEAKTKIANGEVTVKSYYDFKDDSEYEAYVASVRP